MAGGAAASTFKFRKLRVFGLSCSIIWFALGDCDGVFWASKGRLVQLNKTSITVLMFIELSLLVAWSYFLRWEKTTFSTKVSPLSSSFKIISAS